MKKDSNMFNDNSIETEGVPADKTAEIPKVVDSTEEENAKKPLVLFGREFSRKQVCAAGAGILCAAGIRKPPRPSSPISRMRTGK